MKTDYDTIIIGAGVAGMTAAIYLKRAGISCLLIEKEIPGGQINKASKVKNYPGFEEITGPDLANNIFNQVSQLNVPYLNKEVLSIKEESQTKKVITQDGEITTKTIIIATGRTPKRLQIEGEEALLGSGISYCVLCDAPLFKNQEVAVIGGSNSALEESLYLSDICSKVTIINRSPALRGQNIIKEELEKKPNVEILYNTKPIKFNSKNNILNTITVEKNDERYDIKVSGCFIYIGQIPISDRFKDMIDFDKDGYILVDEKKQTNIEGIYAAGDIIKKDAFQLLTAMSDAVLAATSCIHKIKEINSNNNQL